MRRPALSALLVVLLASLASPPAFAAPSAGLLPLGSDMREGVYLLAPQAYLGFCHANPDECAAAGGDPLTLTAADWSKLQSVNGAVNHAIRAVALAGTDVWALGRRAGHCATFAVQKRHELIKAGLPQSALSLAVVYTEQGERHLVLAVRTDRGRLRARQSPGHDPALALDRIPVR